MSEKNKLKKELISEVDQLKERVNELKAISAEQKIALETFKKSEDKYRVLYENTPLSYQSLDEEGCFIDVNPAWLRTLGYKREQVIGKWFGDFLHPDWKQNFEKIFPEFINVGYVSGLQFKIKHRDGHYLDVSFEGSIGSTLDGQFKQIHCIFKDITEWVHAEKALGESEEKLRLIIDNSPIGFSSTDLKGFFIDVNPAMCLMLGYSKKELIAKHFNQISHPDDREKNKKMYQKLVEGKIEYFDLNKRYIHKNGKVIHVLIRSQLARYYEGEPLFEFALVEDITERMQAEKDLRESEERYRTVVENSHNGILIVREDFKFEYVNDPMCQILGCNLEEIIDHDFREFLDEESEKLVSDRYLKRQRGEEVPERYEFNILRKDGGKRRVEISSAIVRDPKGKARTIAQIRDITERKRAEEKISRFSRIFEDSLNEIYLFKTGTLKFTQVNSAGQNNLGYSMEELGELTPLDIKPDFTAKSFAELVAPLRKSETERIVFETVHKRKDGSLYDVEVHLQILHYEKEALFSAIIMDITERKRAEKELLEYTHQLETLNTTTAALSTSLELGKLLDLILDQVGQVLPFDSGAIFLHDEGKLRVMADRGIKPSVKEHVFSSENELFQEIQRMGVPLVVSNI